MLKQLQDQKKYDPKNLDKINFKKETLTNAEKQYNNRDVVETFESGVFPFRDGFRKKESDASDKPLPDWVNVDKKRFDEIKSQSRNAKDNNLQVRPKRGSPIYFNESYKLI